MSNHRDQGRLISDHCGGDDDPHVVLGNPVFADVDYRVHTGIFCGEAGAKMPVRRRSKDDAFG